MPDYSQGKIYKITNDYNDDVYIGSTCESLNTRFHKHKYDSKIEKKIIRPLYKLMNEIGVVRFRIDLIENYPCNDKIALAQREGYFIREQATLNKNIAGRTTDDSQRVYKQLNKEKINKQQREYQQMYLQQNKDEINRKKKENYQENREKILKRQRERYERKKLEKLEKENLAI